MACTSPQGSINANLFKLWKICLAPTRSLPQLLRLLCVVPPAKKKPRCWRLEDNSLRSGRFPPFWLLAVAAGPVGAVGLGVLDGARIVQLPELHLTAWRLLLMLAVAPVVEELVFRGALQSTLTSAFGKMKWRAEGTVSLPNVVTSFLFAGAHALYHHPVLAAAVFFPSLVFGRLKELDGGTQSAIGMHAWYNLVFLLMLHLKQ